MANFSRVISLAYLRILERAPDPDGLTNFNQLMNQGLTEAMMREALLRSPEYAAKNPDVTLSFPRASTAKPKGAARTKKPRKK
jgi:hypothetical protein